jgi:hypothetical protein
LPSESESESELELELELELEPQPQPESQPQPQPQPQSDSESEPETEAKPEPRIHRQTAAPTATPYSRGLMRDVSTWSAHTPLIFRYARARPSRSKPSFVSTLPLRTFSGR